MKKTSRVLIQFGVRHARPLSIIAAVIIVNVFVAWYALTQKTVFYWDESGYWTLAIDLTRAFQNSFASGVEMIGKSLQTDYNLLPTIPFVPFMMIFGESRLVFMLLVTNLYLVPAMILYVHLFDAFFMKHLKMGRRRLFAAGIITAALFPSALFPVLSGQIDAVGLLVIGIVFFIMSKISTKKVHPAWSITLGMNLCLLAVLRRWYSFWVVSAVLAYGVVYLSRVIVDIRKSPRALRAAWQSIRYPLINMSIAGVSALTLLYVLFPYLFFAYFVNYGDLYSAYRSGRVSQALATLNHLGLVVIIMSVMGYVSVFVSKQRDGYIRPIAAFFALQLVIIYGLFTSTQNFSLHHYYLLTPGLLLGVLLLMRWSIATKRAVGRWVFVAVCILSVAHPLYCFGRPIGYRPNSQDLSLRIPLFGRENGPIVRGDINTMKELEVFLRQHKTPEELVYIVSSSDVFNDSLFRNIALPERFVDGIAATSHVDKRDGFNNDFFRARYVIVATPVQLHLKTGQRVVEYLAQDILAGHAPNLQRVARYQLDRGVELVVYEKTDNYPQSFIDGLLGRLRSEYGETHLKIINLQQ